MKKAGVITRASEWTNEGTFESESLVKYVGIRLDESWTDIFDLQNNILIQFTLKKSTAYLDFYLANTPPFYKITSVTLKDSDKWEVLIGTLRNQLKKDKLDAQHHQGKIDNLYQSLKKYLK
jgi:hypothetical protein